MTIYTDKIEVSLSDKDRCKYENFEIRFCAVCKIPKELENFRSLQKHKDYNIVCRRCLDKQNLGRKLLKSFEK